ncbi:MAG: hypothetical protein ABEI86_07960 [Halobacteriaceae archaeon]
MAISEEEIERIVRKEVRKQVFVEYVLQLYREFFDTTPENSDRENEDLSNSEPETIIEEVPIEGGGVDDPETIEVERTVYQTDPRLNGDLDPMEISRALREGLTLEEEINIMEEQAKEETDQMDTDEIDSPGFPWYQ